MLHTQLSGKPENVAKKAVKEKIIDLYNKGVLFVRV